MEKLEFESLVPTNSMDENKKPFIEALKWAINNPEKITIFSVFVYYMNLNLDRLL